MSKKIVLGTAAALLFSVSGALAGGCQGSSCYRLVTSPPVYGSVAENVMVQPARTVARHIPAEFSTVEEKILVRPGRTIAHHTPAVLKDEAETVMVSPASKRWQVTHNAHGQVEGCWVVVPAQYATRHRTVVVAPASVQHEVIPAEYGVRQRTVMVRPAGVEHNTIPAVYETRHRQVIVSHGSQSWQRN
jgi:hypothetical protein